ncbi:class I SAM-dependent methyltransferase [Cellvibrio japonicus]|nr:class I SAM-dependent methyltransferase [Cellvibrio japonicus]
MMNRDFCALNARAVAPLFWPDVGFYDRAASRLAALLNVDGAIRFNPLMERSYLRANRWIDFHCLAFFAHYPKAMAVELGAGLSTRFHRLSEQHEWPQFSWVDVDAPDIVQLKMDAMPLIDNYQLISNTASPQAVVNTCGWQGTTPLLVSIDGISREQDHKACLALLQELLRLRQPGVEIALLLAGQIHERRSGYKSWWRFWKRQSGMINWPQVIAGLGGEIKQLETFRPGKYSCQSVTCISASFSE